MQELQRTSKFSERPRKKLPYIVIQSKTRPLRFIIDCGAEFSIINQNVCSPKWKIPSHNYVLKVLGRNIETSVKYKIPLFEEFNAKNLYVEFLEYQFHSCFDGLIGNNILLKLNPIINYKSRSLITENSNIPFYFDREEEIYAKNCRDLGCLYVFHNDFFENEIANKAFAAHLNKSDVSKLKSLLYSFKSVFYKEGDNLSFTDEIKHQIKTKKANSSL